MHQEHLCIPEKAPHRALAGEGVRTRPLGRGRDGCWRANNQDLKKGGRAVPEVHFYVTRPLEREGVPALEDVGLTLSKLSHVSGVEVDPSESVVAVLFEGGRDEQHEI